ncbi:MAG: GNAT family N-acetyltransferase, partial [Pusillimonas sp.]|nr:GNAT family N-acetyltransferase [Pusillimonas sp.]
MLRHRLAALFDPTSVLVVGPATLPMKTVASQGRLARHQTHVVWSESGSIAWPQSLAGVPPGRRLDLAILVVPYTALASVLQALKNYRPRALIVLSPPSPSATPGQDCALCVQWAREHDCVMLGPRTLGIQRPHIGLNASLSSHLALPGKVALVSQSEAIVSAVLDWARDANLGFSTVASMGDETDLTLANLLDYLATDPRTDSIAVYIEHMQSPRALFSALRAAAAVKPVVVLKAGGGSRNPNSETDAVFNALLRRAGAVRIPYFVQLFSSIKVLRSPVRPKGRRIAVVSNGSGPPQLALDIMGAASAVQQAELS